MTKVNLYTVRDLYGITYDGIYTAPTDGAFCRMMLKNFEHSKIDANEYTPYSLGTFDVDTGEFNTHLPTAISWTAYRVETKSTPISSKEFEDTVDKISR